MSDPSLPPWCQDHGFGQDQARPGERRTRWVIGLTAATMVVEIVAGLVYGSMALLADGLHMASHTAALGLAAFAYAYARRHSHDTRFSFGTGKVNALAGFSGAILLAGFSLLMAGESIERLLQPVSIGFDQALVVAVLGLVVNGGSMLILGGHHHDEAGNHDHADHNLRAAYLHVLADALTSLLAILALLAGKFLGAAWLDPTMGVVGAALVAHWSWGLLRQSGRVLVDRQAPPDLRDRLRDAVEQGGVDRVVDLHLWSIGPGIHAAELVVLSSNPRPPVDYKRRIPPELRVVHVTVEIHREGEKAPTGTPRPGSR